ncbi:MAG: hypothetical protein FWE90_05005 [Defluviitaleaceae bacterium]|nr:hypothetical protein [Defluviitaleaceae bacterium]
MESTGMSVRSKLILMAVLALCAGASIFLLRYLEIGTLITVSVFAAIIAVLVLLTRNLIKTAADPIDRMNKTVIALTDGKMDVNLRSDAVKKSGEVGALENGLAKLAINQHNFNGDLDALVKKAQAGETDVFLDAKDYPGGLRDIAAQINLIVNGYEKINDGVINAVNGFARGDFKPNTVNLNAKSVESLEKLGGLLLTFKEDANMLGQAAKEGRFTARTAGRYSGEWQRISADMDAILDSLIRPVTDIVNALDRLESGTFSVGISGNFQGEFEKIKLSLERINELYSGHLSELSSVLNDISYGRGVNLSRNYRGSFQQVQSAVNSVARGYERIAEDLRRASSAPAQRPTAFNTAAKPATAPAAARPTVTPAAAPRQPASTTPPTAARTQNTAAPPLPVNTGRVSIPSGAHEYNRKDFGKYK